ncbi:ATP-binding protein [Polynucleobacter necessarius]|uniref:ATP-binding protein n=1 Tax=Polynucleobacter necessarius TaxID=576610 RepID=UPI0013B05EB0|nr:ATP-binding protein [Polynucleobacter necessarius]
MPQAPRRQSRSSANQRNFAGFRSLGTGASRRATIIQRIRGFVKRSEPQRKASCITEIINDAVGLVEIEAHRHRLSIASHIAENLPVVNLDPALILQVIVNLLKNALDSVREAYPLSSRWSAPAVKINADLDTSIFPVMLRIQVTDTGGGIPESVLEWTFESRFLVQNPMVWVWDSIFAALYRVSPWQALGHERDGLRTDQAGWLHLYNTLTLRNRQNLRSIINTKFKALSCEN